MDWDKAKKVVIAVLVLLNFGLFGLNYTKNEQYKVSQAEEKAIYEVLGKNGINLYTEIVDTAKPMRQINVTAMELDTDLLKKEFFDEKEDVKISVEFNKTVLKSENCQIDIDSNNIFVEFFNEKSIYNSLNNELAVSIVENYINGKTLFSNYKFDNVMQLDDGFMVEMLESYKGFKLFNSKARFFVNEYGIKTIVASFYGDEAFSGGENDVCMPDEALFTFMQKIKSLKLDTVIYINDMDLGYDIVDKNEIAEGRQLKLVPAYRIYTSYSQEAFIINAYTNELKTD